jgi:uncharacterized membrane protein
MNTPSTAQLYQLLPLACISLILPFYGQSRRGVLFGTTVPLGFAETPEGQAPLRRYRLSVSAMIVIVMASAAAVLRLAPATGLAATLVPMLAIPLELVITFLLWKRGANAIKPYAVNIPLERHTELTPVSTTAPILATAASALPLAASAVWLHLHWSRIPSRFVLHWNAAGIADRWGTRSFDSVYGLLISGALALLLMTASSIFISRANGPQMSQRRRSLVPMAALAWIVSGMFCILALRPLMRFTPSSVTLISSVYLALIVAATLWLLQRGGLAPFSAATEAYDSTPDSKWHAGIIYYNPSDAAVIVPKRFGWGWTFNFARPTAWIYLGAILLFVLAVKVFTN